MRFVGWSLLTLLLAGVWAQSGKQASRQPSPPSSSPQAAIVESSACERGWQEMAQYHQEAAADLNKEISGLRSLVTMLRADAGIVRDERAKSALQVNADMWELRIGTMRKQAGHLRVLGQREEATGAIRCRVSPAPPRARRQD